MKKHPFFPSHYQRNYEEIKTLYREMESWIHSDHVAHPTKEQFNEIMKKVADYFTNCPLNQQNYHDLMTGAIKVFDERYLAIIKQPYDPDTLRQTRKVLFEAVGRFRLTFGFFNNLLKHYVFG